MELVSGYYAVQEDPERAATYLILEYCGPVQEEAFKAFEAGSFEHGTLLAFVEPLLEYRRDPKVVNFKPKSATNETVT